MAELLQIPDYIEEENEWSGVAVAKLFFKGEEESRFITKNEFMR